VTSAGAVLDSSLSINTDSNDQSFPAIASSSSLGKYLTVYQSSFSTGYRVRANFVTP